jgi:hypothetical protein
VRSDAITVELGQPGLVVLAVREREEAIEVAVEYEQREVFCPHCARPTARVHQRHPQWKRDEALWGKRVWLRLWKPRFHCTRCRRSSLSPIPSVGAAAAARSACGSAQPSRRTGGERARGGPLARGERRAGRPLLAGRP